MKLLIRLLTGVVLLAIVLAADLLLTPQWFMVLLVPLVMVMGREWAGLTRHRHWVWRLVGMVYILLPLASLALLQAFEPYFLLWLIAVVVATDVGAYLVGHAIGRTKLAPKISPNKTVEGLVGGMVLAALTGYVLAFALFEIWTFTALGAGAVLALLAQAGDLFESALKRHAGVKDSGNILPGHGGVLDRLDGHLPVWVAGAVWVVGSTVFALTR